MKRYAHCAKVNSYIKSENNFYVIMHLSKQTTDSVALSGERPPRGPGCQPIGSG